ncbi:MAG TPA: ABC transporter permease [Candidatus Sulfotelmatobacter sp.]|nr:ABC transporter permease [Candidatus Sulfotelmatobacter sp.]
MHSQFLPLLRNEITKAARRRVPYFGFFCIGVLCVAIYLAAGRLSGGLSSESTDNGWGYLAFSMQLVFTDLGPIFIVNFAALLLAQETGAGTIRAALAAPVHRWELFAAKATVGLLYMLAISAAALLFSIALAKMNYHFDAVGDSFGVVYGRKEAFHEFLLGYAMSWIPLVPLVAFGLFMSTIIRTPGTAVSVATATLLIIDFTKNLVGLGPYVFTRDITFPWVVLSQLAQGTDYEWRPEVWNMIILSGTFAVAAFGAGLIIFVRQDLNK